MSSAVAGDAVPCPHCEGSGVNDPSGSWGPLRCPKCNGTGEATPAAGTGDAGDERAARRRAEHELGDALDRLRKALARAEAAEARAKKAERYMASSDQRAQDAVQDAERARAEHAARDRCRMREGRRECLLHWTHDGDHRFEPEVSR